MSIALLIVGLALLGMALAHGFLWAEFRAMDRLYGTATGPEQRHQRITMAVQVGIAIACFALAWTV